MQGSSDEVEGHGLRARSVSDEPEVQGQGFSYRGIDANGNEFNIPSDRILSVKWTDAEGEHEVEGHALRAKVLDQEPDVEGHASRFSHLSDDPDATYTIRFTDNTGEEQEVEGHMPLARRLDQEPEVEGHRKRYFGT